MSKEIKDLPIGYKGKIGERWFEVVKHSGNNNCRTCILNPVSVEMCSEKILGYCRKEYRDDKTNVIFKEIPAPIKPPMYRGDRVRGAEIIKELEKLGGINIEDVTGAHPSYVYCINDDNVIKAWLYDCGNAGKGSYNTMLDNTYQLTEFKHKFKIVEFSLEKYDRVIYRDTNEGEWRVGVFEKYVKNLDKVRTTFGGIRKEAIPFNEETKLFIGTSNVPEKKYVYKPKED